MADHDDRSDPAARFATGLDATPRTRRARHLRVYGPPKRHTNLIWIAMAVVGAVLFVVLIRGVLEKSRWTAGASTQAPAAPR